MSEWQPIETAPKGKRLCADGVEREQMVMVWAGGCRFARQCQHGQWRGTMGRPINVPPTHWMPLPEAPQ